MSHTTSPPLAHPTSQPTSADTFVAARIAETCRALWWEEVIRRMLKLFVAMILAVLVWVVIDQWIHAFGPLLRGLSFLGFAGSGLYYFFTQVVPVLTSTVRPEYAARALERDMPELKHELTSYVTLRESSEQSESAKTGLHGRVIRSIGSRAAGHLRSHDALPTEATATLRWWILAAAALAMLMAYAAISPKSTVASASRLLAPIAAIDPANRVLISDVQPGDVEAIAGRKVTVSADVEGLRDAERVSCRWQSTSREHEFDLNYNEETFRFEGELQLSHSDSGQLPYRIVAGDAESKAYHLSVKNQPVVAIQSVYYQPPAYTGAIPHTSSSAAITAVDGTNVTITAKTNRPVVSAEIEFNPRVVGETVRATAGSKSLSIDSAGTQLTITFPLRSQQGRSAAVQLEGYRIRVRDDVGQGNPDPIVYPIQVIEDLPPEISIVLPRKSPKSMGVELQQLIEIHAMDPDFGLRLVELEIRRGIDLVEKSTLWSDPQGAKGNQVTEYRFRPSEHGLRVGDVVQITGVATDNRMVPSDSKVEANRSVTDPVEIRIVADQPAPDPQGADDGLGETDQQPASDHPQDSDGGEKSASEEGDQKQGGSGGKGESTQQQKGEGGSQSGEGQSGKDSSDPQENGESGESQGSGQSGQQENGEPAKGASQGESGDGNRSPAEGDPNDMSEESGNPNAAESSESQDNQDGAQGKQAGEQSSKQAGESGTQTSDGNDATQGEPSGKGGEQNSNGTQSSRQQPDGPPKHDGETFEKIKDYLDKKKNEASKEPESGKGQSADSQKDEGSGESDPSTDKNSSADGSKSNEDPSDPSSKGEGSGQKADPQTSDKTGGGTEPPKDSAGNPDKNAKSESEQLDSEGSDGAQGADDAQENKDNGMGQDGSRQPGEPEGDGQKPDDTGDPETQSGESGAEQKNQDTGKPGDGKQGNGESDSPSQKGAGQQGAGQQGAGQQDAGKKGAGQQDDAQQNDRPPGEGQNQQNNKDQNASSEPTDRESDAANNDAANKNDSGDAGDSDAGDKGPKDGSQGDNQQSDGMQGDDSANGNPNPQDSSSGEDQKQSGKAPPSGDPQNADRQNGDPQNADPQSSGSDTDGGDRSPSGADGGAGESGDGAPAAETADLEYTKKATDMVLDYLEETRDTPDKDLLKELDWTEKDLKQFAERWKKTRQMDLPPDTSNEQGKGIRDALESLGMRPPSDDQQDVRREAADDLRRIRDSGNRRPPPAAYKDVFDAFRRGLGRQK